MIRVTCLGYIKQARTFICVSLIHSFFASFASEIAIIILVNSHTMWIKVSALHLKIKSNIVVVVFDVRHHHNAIASHIISASAYNILMLYFYLFIYLFGNPLAI